MQLSYVWRFNESSLRTQGPITLASKVKKGLCAGAKTRVLAAAMSAIALTLGSLRSQGRPVGSLCEAALAPYLRRLEFRRGALRRRIALVLFRDQRIAVD
jgi:hypothetical protein